MRYNLLAGAIVAASITEAVAQADCSKGSVEEEGNWYCQAVQKIQYTGLGKPGAYQKVTNMYPTCQQSSQSYSGLLAPFDEQVSLHFRGPIKINQVAVYTPSSSSPKSKARRSAHERRHGHAGFHKRNKEIREIQERAEEEKRQVGAMVTAVIDGKTAVWTNEYSGPSAPTGTPASAAASSAAPAAAGFIGNATSAADEVAAAAATPSSVTSEPAAAGDWTRDAYYKQDSQTAEGLVWLNNKGGGPSGVFDNLYGNSLSYSTPDGTSAASSPQVFNGTLESNQELIMFSDEACGSDGSCGYFRKGSVAYKGFDGPEKLFLFEFSMPIDGKTGPNGDMPSVWMLNAQIARTAQYSDCSCWATGCGEFDICEVLNSGNTKCKSTWHGKNPGGSSDYFNRPTTSSINMAVLMANNAFSIQVLEDSQEFSSSMSKSFIDSLSGNSPSNIISSLFALDS